MGALPVVAVDESEKALRDPNAHVEAVGQDETHTATPAGQDMDQHQEGRRQGQHCKIVPGERRAGNSGQWVPRPKARLLKRKGL